MPMVRVSNGLPEFDNSHFVRVNGTTITKEGPHVIMCSGSWIDRIDWGTSQRIYVNGVSVPLLYQANEHGERRVADLETEYYRALTSFAVVQLKVGDVVTANQTGIYDSTRSLTPIIYRYEP